MLWKCPAQEDLLLSWKIKSKNSYKTPIKNAVICTDQKEGANSSMVFFWVYLTAYFLILSWAESRSWVCFLQKYCLSIWRCFCISWLRVEKANINVFRTCPTRPLGWKMKSESLMHCFGRYILQLIVVLLLIQLIPIYIIYIVDLVYTLGSELGTFIFRRESNSWETQQPQG